MALLPPLPGFTTFTAPPPRARKRSPIKPASSSSSSTLPRGPSLLVPLFWSVVRHRLWIDAAHSPGFPKPRSSDFSDKKATRFVSLAKDSKEGQKRRGGLGVGGGVQRERERNGERWRPSGVRERAAARPLGRGARVSGRPRPGGPGLCRSCPRGHAPRRRRGPRRGGRPGRAWWRTSAFPVPRSARRTSRSSAPRPAGALPPRRPPLPSPSHCKRPSSARSST